jgi:hypothetical protein
VELSGLPGVPTPSMNHVSEEDRDPVSTLLSKAPRVKASAAFCRNVVRLIRMDESAPDPGFLEWVRSGWNWLSLAGATAAIALVVVATQTDPTNLPSMAAADSCEIDEVLRSADFSVIANLDVLMAMEENDVWLEASAR